MLHTANKPDHEQVILSFLLSASLLVIYILIYYLTVYDPDLDPYRPINQPHLLAEIPNPVDRTFLRLSRRLCATILCRAHLERIKPSWLAEGAFEKALLKVRSGQANSASLYILIPSWIVRQTGLRYPDLYKSCHPD